MNALFFWLFSVAMIGCGLAVILNRNPVASAISFAFTIFFMAGLFVMLNAFFLAAVQVLVTAGAVMVLFLFIIMLLDITTMEHIPRRKLWMGCALVLGLGLLYIVGLTLNATPQGAMGIDEAPAVGVLSDDDAAALKAAHPGASDSVLADFNDDTHQIGRLLFTTYVAPFEVTSLLILVATVGVVVLCKEEAPVRRKTAGEVDAEPQPETGPALTATR